MAYKALYREWRPKNFTDVVGQKHVTTTLRNAIKNNRIAHAYLLCGTRGTGKTSTAKILSKAINCLNPQDGEPCNQCDMCIKINNGTAIDVTELDAASHNSVDNIRDIIEEVQYPPQEAKYKVFIIDEVHMLSIGAVNAFLKTLEEPPARVIFILATTDPQKLPITILSRCQRFDFKRISSSDIFYRLKQIAETLDTNIDEESLKLLSRMCDGAMRDALSILDQAIAIDNKVSYENLIDMLGITTNHNLIEIVDKVINKKIEEAIKLVNKIINDGKDVNILIRDLITHMRNLLMVNVSNNPEDILDMSLENIHNLKEQSKNLRVEEIMRYINILQEAENIAKSAKQGRIYLELALIKMCKIQYDTSIETILKRLNKLEEDISLGKIVVQGSNNQSLDIGNIIKDNKKKILNINKSNEEIEVKNETIKENPESKLTVEHVKKAFKDIQNILKNRNNVVLATMLSIGQIYSCNKGIITISFENNFKFHKSRLEKEEHKKIINDTFSEALKERVIVKYIIEDESLEEERSKESVLSEMFPEELIEIYDE